jgi:DNA polymerase elongation subunit (family B)
VTKEEFDIFLLEKFQKTEKGRRRIAKYVLKDAYLPLAIEEAKKYTYTLLETSHIAKIPIQSCINRAQGAKIEGRLMQSCAGLNEQEEYDLETENKIKKRKRIKEDYVKYLMECGSKRQKSLVKYKGATVIEPVIGYYGEDAVLVFDFSSMYPSILMFLNLCYSTLVSPEEIKKRSLIRGKDYIKIYTGQFLPTHPDQDIFYADRDESLDDPTWNLPCFMKKEVQPGILPTIEVDLFKERKGKRFEAGLCNAESKLLDEIFKKASSKEIPTKQLFERWLKDLENLMSKKKVKTEYTAEFIELLKVWKGDLNNPEYIKLKEKTQQHYHELQFEYNLLDANQIAIKEWMNSIYGICGDTTSKYQCKPIATTITSTGRWLLELVKIIVETQFCRKNGYPFDAKVIYGDTDSIFVVLQGFVQCAAAVFAYGKIIGDYINQKLKKYHPMEINFEKFYTHFGLVNPKTYYGYKWMPFTEENKNEPELDTKGMQYKKGNTVGIAKDIAKCCVEFIVKESNLPKAIEYFKARIQEVIHREIHLGQLIYKAKLGKELSQYGSKERIDPVTGEVTFAKTSLSPSVALAIRTIVEDELQMLIDSIKECFENPKIKTVYDQERTGYKITCTGKKIAEPKEILENKMLVKEDDSTYFMDEHDLLKRCSQPSHAGDFINYVLVETDKKTEKKSDFAEDPLKVLQENIPYNVKAYIQTILNTVMRVFSGPLGYDIKEGTKESKRLEPDIDPKKPWKNGWKLSNKQEKEITKILLGVSSVKKLFLKDTILTTSPMFKFVQKIPQCILCKLTLDNTNKLFKENEKEVIIKNVCKHCYDILDELKTREEEKLIKKQKEYDDTWDLCRVCLDTNDMEELLDCKAIECSTYSQRDFVKKRLVEQEDKLERIGSKRQKIQ